MLGRQLTFIKENRGLERRCCWQGFWPAAFSSRGCLLRLRRRPGPVREIDSQPQKETLMSKNAVTRIFTVAIGFALLFALPLLAGAQSAPPRGARSSRVVSTGNQSKANVQFSDDFAGLTFTDEQKAAIEKIHEDAESFKSQIVKDEKLNDDQKSAMLVGYARIEYSRKLTVLTREQQRTVRQRLQARRAAEQAQQKSPPPQR